MLKFIAILISLSFALSSFAQRQTWVIDPAYTSVQFSVEHLGIGKVSGYFRSFGGNITAENEEFKDALINFYINTKSLHSENNIRDNQLRSAAFLAASRHPTILFESEKLIKVSPNKYKVKGVLTIRGIEQTVEFDVDYGGLATDDEGSTRAGFTLRGRVDRFKYGINWDEKVNNVPIVGKEIEFIVNLNLVRAD